MMWNDKITMVGEQFSDIIAALKGNNECRISLVCNEKENAYGGNPARSVTFNMEMGDIPYKEKVFSWQMASQTEEGFVNGVKAYLMDVLDAVVNL